MAIQSSAFGRVTLTGEDAKKFQDQMTYGRPKEAAKASAKRGVSMARSMAANGGKLALSIEKPRVVTPKKMK